MSIGLTLSRQMRSQIGTVTAGAGQQARLRRYISEAGGTPWEGTAATQTRTELPITLIQATRVTIEQVAQSGGQLVAGDVRALSDVALQQEDSIQFLGVEWKVASEPTVDTLHGRRYYRSILRRQGQ